MISTFQPFTDLLHLHLGFNLSRIKCLCMLLEGMIRSRTVNLSMLAPGMGGTAKTSSHYMRLRRFMKEVFFESSVLSRFLVLLMNIPTEKMTLILDRTNWQFGRVHINILYLAVFWNGLAIPLFGHCLKIRNVATQTILIV